MLIHPLDMKLTTVLTVLSCACSAYPGKSEFCDSLIYCQGQILDTVQKSKIFQDSKSFVDLTLVNHPNVTLRKFREFMRYTQHSPNGSEVKHFVEGNFIEESGLEDWTPVDYNTRQQFIERIDDILVREFAMNLVEIWPSLGRKVKKSVGDNPDKYSLIYLPNGFIIPGGRFREMYYWDSYWIIKGLLLSGMKETVRGMLENFVYLINKYGFVPNGSRVYYLNRSQPPLLALMVGLYIDSTNDIEWLRRNIGLLEKELRWWLKNRVTVVRKKEKDHFVAYFSSETDTPRPEAYHEDINTCVMFQKEKEKKNCYRNLRSGAESGWDFSSRWMFHSNNTTQVRRVAPVDLNSYLCKAFKELSRFYKLIGDTDKSTKWLQKSIAWEESIETIFYNAQDGIWYDYDIALSRSRKLFYLSNFTPLWCETYNTTKRIEYGTKAVMYLNNLGINNFMSGIPISLKKSGEQWDMPNAFPPLQEILILGLLNTGQAEAKELAETFARRWISTNIRSYNKNGVMFEKYHAEDPDKLATGGEYTVQYGFGWTNGVALSLIEQFYTEK